MANTQQSAEITSSQSTHVAVQETKTAPSGQNPPTGILRNSDTASVQDLARNDGDSLSGSDEDSSGEHTSFTISLRRYQEKLDHNFNSYQESIDKANASEDSIDEFDWDELELAYQKEIGEIVMKEREVMSQFDARFKQFMLWMQVSDERENQRAVKRIKTQSAFVQNSEQELAQKEQHYANVMQAFQNAMSLLSRPS